MELTSHADREEIRSVARSMLDERSPLPRVRRLCESGERLDRELWTGMAGLGWMAIETPEPLGGSGLGFDCTAIVLTELGRSLAGGPFLSSAVLGVGALLLADRGRLREDLLPALASGDRVATVTIGECLGAGGGVRADGTPSGWRLSGRADLVPDAGLADVLVVVARDGAGGPLVAAVEPTAPGVQIVDRPTLDLTRAFGAIDLSGVDVGTDRVLAAGSSAEALVRRLADRAAVALASDALGVASRCLDLTTAYANEREQFGRPIGAFQAVKHQCADVFVAVQALTGLVEAASDAVALGSPVAPTLASMAKSYAGQAARDAAGVGIQLHGGIGYTWEHDMHLLFKRANLDAALGGDGRWHRRRLADLMFGPDGTMAAWP